MFDLLRTIALLVVIMVVFVIANGVYQDGEFDGCTIIFNYELCVQVEENISK